MSKRKQEKEPYRIPQIGDVYIVKYSKGYGSGAFRVGLVGGSNVMKPSGSKRVILKDGDLVEYAGGAPDGTTWFKFNDERMKFEGNGWCNFLSKNLKLKEG